MSAALASDRVGLEADPIREVTCFDCSVPLPRPLLVGPATVTRRSYAVVRIRAESGLEGAAYAFGRGLPVARIIERALAPLLLGADSSRPELVRGRLSGAYWPYAERGLFPAAASAVDLALWDLLGQRTGGPLADPVCTSMGNPHATFFVADVWMAANAVAICALRVLSSAICWILSRPEFVSAGSRSLLN